MKDVLGAADLVGCRYRLVQRRAHPEIPRTHASLARAERHAAAVDAALANLPVKAPGRFRRIDIEGDEWERSMATLEALAYGYTHITNAVFATDEWKVEVDLLLQEGEKYTPVIVSNHRVARRNERARTLAVPTHRIGLSEPLEMPYKIRHHAVDGYRLAFAALALEELGLNSGRGGAIGQDRSQAFFTDTSRYNVEGALAQPLPTGPRRVKECATCRFWQLCEPELVERDDISLFLPGDRANPYRERGIETVQALIDAHLGEPSQLAQAWREGQPLLRRAAASPSVGIEVPRADVEVDVDMEAYLDQGAYLWGAWYQGEYRAFVTWEPLGGRAEAANFEEFWSWLMGLRAEAHAAGKTFAAYCYSAHGENHWMRMSAKRFGRPALAEVEEFISSGEWVDMFVHVKCNFAGPYGLGLKTVAPLAGFEWPEDFDGEESVNARREALAGDMEVRQQILDYNAGDVQATRAIREFMSAGAPGVPNLGAISVP
ncbi:TM0106 family RecB-like putative nuclease [Corynebacterium striatum]|uniref:TM0106 family RecB-like putative nuclease n=1 Tax=Corynebacterium striatum TaxID=43770 RepID=UPI00254F98CC|nr:TM0106 family RecB-like putative nuclease [Corynebacterium striatum]MDK7885210.1 TM0106 family RecB-like putative nuclease [Corynebacterium striatum]